MKRAARLAILYTLEAVAAVFSLLIFIGALGLWRLAEGPVEAQALRTMATEALLDTTGADVAAIGRVQVYFDPRLAAIVVSADNVSAARAGGDVIVDAEKIEAALALDWLIVGRAKPVRLAVNGGQLSFLRTHDGNIHAGLGGVDAVRSTPDASVEDLNAMSGSSRASQNTLTDPSGMLDRLREVDLRGVDLHVVDEVTDINWQMRDLRAQLGMDDQRLEIDVSTGLITSAGLAPVALRLDSGRNLQSFFIDLRIRDLVPAAAAPRLGPGAALQALDAPLSIDLVVDATVETGLRTAMLDVKGAPGLLRLGGETYDVRASELVLLLDAGGGSLDIQSASIDTDLIELNLQGRLFDFSNYQDALPSFARFELSGENGFVNLGGVFPEPPAWRSFDMQGHLDRSDLTLVLDDLQLQLNAALGSFSGRAWLEDVDGARLPNLQLEGPIEGIIRKSDVLGLWPVEFALGARDWVRDSILDGELSNAQLRVDIPASAIAAGALQNEHLDLSFDFNDSDVRYMSTMTPLEGLSGSAVLRGDSLSLEGTGGTIGALQADTIFVEIPRFNPKGAQARFGGTGRGPVRDFLYLVDEPPLEIPTDYGLNPDEFDGEGEIAFEIRRPMLRSVPPEDMSYDVTGTFNNVVAPTGFNDASLENGIVEISVSPDGFFADADAELAGTPAQLNWVETFGLEDGEASSAVELRANMTGRAIDRLGFPLRRFFDGMVGVEAHLKGRGMDFTSLDARLDLTEAAVSLPANIWEKPAGEAATAQIVSSNNDFGGLQLDAANLSGEGIEVAMSAQLAADGRLLNANIDKLEVTGAMDLSAVARRPQGDEGVLSVEIDARYLDIGDLFSPAGSGGGFDFVTAPIDIDAMLDRVLVRGYVFDNVDLSARAGPEGLVDAAVTAQTSKGPLLIEFGPDETLETGERRLVVETEDAGQLLSALAGYDNVIGGQLRLTGSAPPVGEIGMSSGTLVVGPFTLERMPLLARILGAGSLEGLASLLSGEQGVEFERLESNYMWQDGVLMMSNSRLAGASLGVTWAGQVDLAEQNIEIDGTILPSYGVNSVLGAIPVLGELLTSRRGEGIFGITYSAVGPFDETRITVNPLSAFAPGVFRRIFEGTSSANQVDALQAEIDRSTPEPEPELEAEPEPDPPEIEILDAETPDSGTQDDSDAPNEGDFGEETPQ